MAVYRDRLYIKHRLNLVEERKICLQKEHLIALLSLLPVRDKTLTGYKKNN